MRIETDAGIVEIINEPAHTFCSADNVRSYPVEHNLTVDSRPFSIHGLILNGAPLAVFGRGGGPSSVHQHSGVYVDSSLYLAVGDCVVCVELKPFRFQWMLETDSATCFGIHFDTHHQALISHGELEISRFSNDGRLLWNASGADIFTGEFSLHPQYVQAIDWNDRVYRFRYEDGGLVN
ncbi:hypothetical protein ACFPN2_09800 [Steroidobacter flavus]|uniref:Uncharacterized protein n=1 Tax=Steroidobacter flavus TaxID=1842136 RepID=A0ABV8SP61_9GAMM